VCNIPLEWMNCTRFKRGCTGLDCPRMAMIVGFTLGRADRTNAVAIKEFQMNVPLCHNCAEAVELANAVLEVEFDHELCWDRHWILDVVLGGR